MQATLDTDADLVRGAEGIRDYLNSRIRNGKPLSSAQIYAMIKDGRIPVVRLGPKGSKIWARCSALDKAFRG